MIRDLMKRYAGDLSLKGYKKRSIQSYVRAVMQLLNYYMHERARNEDDAGIFGGGVGEMMNDE